MASVTVSMVRLRTPPVHLSYSGRAAIPLLDYISCMRLTEGPLLLGSDSASRCGTVAGVWNWALFEAGGDSRGLLFERGDGGQLLILGRLNRGGGGGGEEAAGQRRSRSPSRSAAAEGDAPIEVRQHHVSDLQGVEAPLHRRFEI